MTKYNHEKLLLLFSNYRNIVLGCFDTRLVIGACAGPRRAGVCAERVLLARGRCNVAPNHDSM